MGAPEFTVDVSQNEYLAAGAGMVSAIVTVTAVGADEPGYPPDAAEIIITDCSGSMAAPRTKIVQAREATAVAIDTIRDGVAFAVVAGTRNAQLVYPDDGGLAVAGELTRHAA